ncbi:MAG: hypothetical protein NTX82_02795 [Candidatus Parcubacteria bacterium]|nr:hypothetical protein [Candidatus Parcubacteria bacterium]
MDSKIVTETNKGKVIMRDNNVRIEVVSQITDPKFQEELWAILEKAKTFTDLVSPWRQNLNQEEFLVRIAHPDVLVFVMYEDDEIIGFTYNTNNLDLAPWLNHKFFQHNCPNLFEQKKIWCNIGIVVRLEKQDKGFLKKLILETWDFGTSDGRIMIVDFSWRIFGGASWIDHTLKYGKAQKQKDFRYTIYERQQFSVCWNQDEGSDDSELAAFKMENPIFGKKSGS